MSNVYSVNNIYLSLFSAFLLILLARSVKMDHKADTKSPLTEEQRDYYSQINKPVKHNIM